jgi:isocitrate lyase
MNTNDIIQEEADFSEWVNLQTDPLRKAGDYYDALPFTAKKVIDYAVKRYITHFLTHTKEKHGAELVKVDGEDQQIVQTIRTKKGLYGHTRSTEQMIEEALAIGRLQGRKEAGFTKNTPSIIDWDYTPPPKTDL